MIVSSRKVRSNIEEIKSLVITINTDGKFEEDQKI